MGGHGTDEIDDPFAMLVECLENPAAVKGRLPRIVGLFESDDRVTRLCAAWSCCLIANEIEDEDTIEYLVRRLSDRLDEEYVSLELTTTLDYVSTRYAEHVETILEEMDEEERERGEIPLPRVGNFTRANYYSNDHSRDGVGRTRIAGAEDGGQRASYANRIEEERERAEYEQNRETDETDDEMEETADADESDDDTGRSGPMAGERTEVTSIATKSRFEKLHILATRERSRYADVYEALVGKGGEEAAVALRLLHEPNKPTEQRDFRERIEEQLADWERVSDHPHVVSVLDWGIEPRPWVTTEFVGESLADVGSLRPAQAVADAASLAEAVSTLHNHGVVHGGIDLGNVIYPDDIVEKATTSAPFLDSVGLMAAFRFHFQPALMLDPRFAAPEYFDSQYGRIGPSTDIYHLGAVIYYLFTGQPPFSGQFDTVRDCVLGEEPPAPSTVGESVPPDVDEIVSKAMSKQKLTRYETVEHLEQELSGLRGGQDDG